VLNTLEAAGELGNTVITYVDDSTGNIVSKSWNSLDPDTQQNLKRAGFIIGALAGPASKTIQTAANASKINLPDLSDVARNRGAGLCFVAGTPVLTTEGYKNIEDIQLGDMIVSRDEERQMTVVKPVTELFFNPNKQIWSVTLVAEDGPSETLGATEEHPFYVDGKGWVEAAELQAGDQVVSQASGEGQGGFLLVKSVVLEDERQDTYNFEVADTHTYFVGKLNALVHNTCSADDLIGNGGRQLDNDTIIGAYGNRFTRNADGTYTNSGPATQWQINQAGVNVRPAASQVTNRGTLNVTAANPSASERAAAEHMSGLGRNVELRDPVGTRAGGGTSDLLVDGVLYDVYTPTSANPNRIISAIAKKNDQATGIVVDLSNSPVTADQLGNVLGRVNGAGATNITDIVIIGN
jgi:hypothetical protein